MAKPTLVGENDQTIDSGDEDMEDFWQTSVGKFRFTIDELPQQLQYIHQLLKVIRTIVIYLEYDMTDELSEEREPHGCI